MEIGTAVIVMWGMFLIFMYAPDVLYWLGDSGRFGWIKNSRIFEKSSGLDASNSDLQENGDTAYCWLSSFDHCAHRTWDLKLPTFHFSGGLAIIQPEFKDLENIFDEDWRSSKVSCRINGAVDDAIKHHQPRTNIDAGLIGQGHSYDLFDNISNVHCDAINPASGLPTVDGHEGSMDIHGNSWGTTDHDSLFR